LAASAFRLRLTGSNSRSRRAADPLRPFMISIITAIQFRLGRHLRRMLATQSSRLGSLILQSAIAICRVQSSTSVRAASTAEPGIFGEFIDSK
jgi:hypothetical protein